MDLKDHKVEHINKKIEEAEEEIEKLKMEIQHDGNKFSGIAFVSFLTEVMRQEVFDNNQHT